MSPKRFTQIKYFYLNITYGSNKGQNNQHMTKQQSTLVILSLSKTYQLNIDSIVPVEYIELFIDGFVFRGSTQWNMLPNTIKLLQKNKFKVELKQWVRTNISQF